jgi:DNA (cytosine-5)-methyltransferase 1
MRHASFFSGVGGLDLGFEAAGIETVSVSEIEPYCNAVLATHWSEVPNLGDITSIDPDAIPDADVWSGGFPCQDLSLAGKRRGFGGERSVLAFTFLDLVERRRPRWFIFENVPGLLSSPPGSRGADFRRLTDEVADLGYGWAYRVLDARYFGVAQRRRRVFLVASLGSGRAAEVLFEPEGVRWHPASRGEARSLPPASAATGSDGEVARSLTASMHKRHDEDTDTMVVSALGAANGGVTSLNPWESKGCRVLDTSGVAHTLDLTHRRPGSVMVPQVAPTLVVGGRDKAHRAGDSYDNTPWADTPAGVRRLTPVECERLMGWPDGWTIPAEWRGKRYDGSDLLPVGLDSARYRCCGNGVVAPVAEWIGRRLRAVIESTASIA